MLDVLDFVKFNINPLTFSLIYDIIYMKDNIKEERGMNTRKLVILHTPREWDNPKQYHIGYAYYDDHGRWTGESEDAILSEEGFYNLFKPILTYSKEKGR